jgi:hypothetical protein
MTPLERGSLLGAHGGSYSWGHQWLDYGGHLPGSLRTGRINLGRWAKHRDTFKANAVGD